MSCFGERCVVEGLLGKLQSGTTGPPMDPVSASVPWGTEWIGKTSDMGGYFSNVRVPFYKSIRVTAQLPKGTAPMNVYTIIRGQENVPLKVGGVELPPTAKLRVHHFDKQMIPSLGFTPIVNLSHGSGVVFGHSVAIEGQPNFAYLEGCFHLLTPYLPPASGTVQAAAGVSANFPGVTLSTGMEDYYDSSFYFHAGIFQQSVSGITHMCAGGGRANGVHPPCPGKPPPSSSRWAAYRFHDRDPLWFANGVQLIVRNGDVSASVPYGQGKCYNLLNRGGPGPSNVSATAWVYEWEDAAQVLDNADADTGDAITI